MSIKITESFTSENYSVPDSIFLFSKGKGEIEYNYNLFFKNLKKRFAKRVAFVDYLYNDKVSDDNYVESFEEIDYKSIDSPCNTICVLALGKVSKSMEKDEMSNLPEQMSWNYELYMILIDKKRDKILLKRKFDVTSNYLLYKGNSHLIKAIEQELKLNK